MEEDITSELPCTLAIEDSTQDSAEPNEMDQVSLPLIPPSRWNVSVWKDWPPFHVSLNQPRCDKWLNSGYLFSFQFQFKEIVLTEEEKRLLSKEGATIPTHMPLTKVLSTENGHVWILRNLLQVFFVWPISCHNNRFHYFFLLPSKPEFCLMNFIAIVFFFSVTQLLLSTHCQLSFQKSTKRSLLCQTGRGADIEKDQEENPQQAVCSGEPQEEEGLCGWTGKQVR